MTSINLTAPPAVPPSPPLPPVPMSLDGLLKYIQGLYRTLAQAINTLWARKLAPNWNTTTQSLGTGDTYIVGSNVKAPSGGFRAGTVLRWTLGVTKTAAGVANPQFIIRIGTGASTSDAAILTFTFPAQTGALDSGVFQFTALLQREGAAAILTGIATMGHALASTGFSVQGSYETNATSSAFDDTVPLLQAGLSANFGGSSAVTVQMCVVEAFNLQ